MEYSRLSDFEINKLVAQAKRYPLKSTQHFGDAGLSIVILKHGYPSHFDPCRNPADAWQIIVDNEISLNSYSGTWEASYEYDAPIGAFGTDEIVTKAVEGKNPLRTAMIAFLMKRERANA